MHAAVLVEDFNDVPGLTGGGWVVVNNSTPPTATNWFQGTAGVFSAHAGAPQAYAAANYVAGTSPGGISLWLISPMLTFAAGDTIAFYTRTESPVVFPDNLELRLSTNGARTDVGATETSVGDFSLLLAVNPGFSSSAYPEDWAMYSAVVNFAGAGRFAFRYVVDDLSINGNYVGIDTLTVGAARQTDIPEPSTLALMGLGAAALVAARRKQ